MGRARGWGGCPAPQRATWEPARGAVTQLRLPLLMGDLAPAHLLLDILCVCSVMSDSLRPRGL